MTAEHALLAALDGLEQPVTIWWRDDDAGRDNPRLRQLLELARARQAPLSLAVVPAWLAEEAAGAVSDCPTVSVLQHGIAHADHAAPGARKIELGGHAALAELEEGLAAGLQRLEAAFGGRFRPVLTPPWNRIDAAFVPRLPALGFSGLSRFGPRASASVPGLSEVNTHLDLVLWRQQRRPMTLGEACGALASLVMAGPAEPLGLLTHHLAMDAPAFAALDRLLALLQDHPKVRLAGAEAVFGEAG